jgi:hypothetical protein
MVCRSGAKVLENAATEKKQWGQYRHDCSSSRECPQWPIMQSARLCEAATLDTRQPLMSSGRLATRPLHNHSAIRMTIRESGGRFTMESTFGFPSRDRPRPRKRRARRQTPLQATVKLCSAFGSLSLRQAAYCRSFKANSCCHFT